MKIVKDILKSIKAGIDFTIKFIAIGFLFTTGTALAGMVVPKLMLLVLDLINYYGLIDLIPEWMF